MTSPRHLRVRTPRAVAELVRLLTLWALAVLVLGLHHPSGGDDPPPADGHEPEEPEEPDEEEEHEEEREQEEWDEEEE